MKAHLIRIGNSRGIRIPKAVLDQCGFDTEIEMEVQGSDLILHHSRKPREGWSRAFARMAELGEDRLLDPPANTAWDEKKWEW